ncbi:MAG: hypothetical protein WCG80_19775 [Spirochaetales bacterium]
MRRVAAGQFLGFAENGTPEHGDAASPLTPSVSGIRQKLADNPGYE